MEVPADRINLEFVLPNKVMVGTVNANREYFELGVRDMAQAEAQYLGWLGRLLAHPVTGLENYRGLVDTLTMTKGPIKVFCEVVGFDRDLARGGGWPGPEAPRPFTAAAERRSRWSVCRSGDKR